MNLFNAEYLIPWGWNGHDFSMNQMRIPASVTSTCQTEEELRDGARAVSLIRPLALYTENWWQLDTLAAALAETGAFEDAVNALQLALTRAENIGPRDVQQLVDHLASYRAERPLRE